MTRTAQWLPGSDLFLENATEEERDAIRERAVAAEMMAFESLDYVQMALDDAAPSVDPFLGQLGPAVVYPKLLGCKFFAYVLPTDLKLLVAVDKPQVNRLELRAVRSTTTLTWSQGMTYTNTHTPTHIRTQTSIFTRKLRTHGKVDAHGLELAVLPKLVCNISGIEIEPLFRRPSHNAKIHSASR